MIKKCYNYCPHCEKRIFFKMSSDDIDTSKYPAPAYLVHNDPECNKLSTFYFDSLLRVSYKELEKKPGGIKTIEVETIQ